MRRDVLEALEDIIVLGNMMLGLGVRGVRSHDDYWA